MDMDIQQGDSLFHIPLTARYYRTAGVINAGLANSNATYTITYEESSHIVHSQHSQLYTELNDAQLSNTLSIL